MTLQTQSTQSTGSKTSVSKTAWWSFHCLKLPEESILTNKMYTWKKLFFCGLFPYETDVLQIAFLENKIQWDEKK